MDDQALVEGSVVFKDEADPAGRRAQLVGPIARTQHLRIRKASGKTAPSQQNRTFIAQEGGSRAAQDAASCPLPCPHPPPASPAAY